MASPYAPPHDDVLPDDAPSPDARGPSPGWAAVMSLLMPGVGQYYAGSTGRGVLIYAAQTLAGAVLVGLALVSPWIILWGPMTVWVLFGVGAAVDARRLARRSTAARGPIAILFTALLLILASRLVWATTRHFIAESAQVPSGGMAPTLLPGDFVLIDKRTAPPERGDVVLFAFPENRNQHFIQRVVGMPGDTVTMRGGALIINGTPVRSCELGSWDGRILYVEWLDERAHLIAREPEPAPTDRTWKVSLAGFFMLGDNRDASYDSREWYGGKGGVVPDEDLIGRGAGIWFSSATSYPFDRVGIDVQGIALPPGAEALEQKLAACLRNADH